MKNIFFQTVKYVLVILAPCLIPSQLLARHRQPSPFSVSENYLTRHDIVYLSTQLEAEGFPMGNGNMGGMIWNHDNGIEIQINKNDLWTTPNPAGIPLF